MRKLRGAVCDYPNAPNKQAERGEHEERKTAQIVHLKKVFMREIPANEDMLFLNSKRF